MFETKFEGISQEQNDFIVNEAIKVALKAAFTVMTTNLLASLEDQKNVYSVHLAKGVEIGLAASKMVTVEIPATKENLVEGDTIRILPTATPKKYSSNYNGNYLGWTSEMEEMVGTTTTFDPSMLDNIYSAIKIGDFYFHFDDIVKVIS